MNLITVENDIIAKLIADISGVKVESWPDNPADYRLLHPGGALLIRYQGSTYPTPEPNSQKIVVQDRVSNWEISIMQQSLKDTKGQHGIYTLLESVRASLTGYTITGLADASIMYPTGDSFTREDAGMWLYSMAFAFTFPEAEV